MVATTMKPNNQNSPKMRRIRVHVVLILILASLFLAVYWVNGVLSESTALFVKKTGKHLCARRSKNWCL